MYVILHNVLPARDEKRHFGRLDKLVKAAQKYDVMKFLPGLSKLKLVKDFDKWNAHYQYHGDGRDEIVVQEKVLSKPFEEQLQIFMHEIGHRGEFRDRPLYKCYLHNELGTEANFLAMANEAHQRDFRENGIAKNDRLREVFAESYSRFTLKRPMPDALKAFWDQAKIGARLGRLQDRRAGAAK